MHNIICSPNRRPCTVAGQCASTQNHHHEVVDPPPLQKARCVGTIQILQNPQSTPQVHSCSLLRPRLGGRPLGSVIRTAEIYIYKSISRSAHGREVLNLPGRYHTFGVDNPLPWHVLMVESGVWFLWKMLQADTDLARTLSYTRGGIVSFVQAEMSNRYKRMQNDSRVPTSLAIWP